MEQKLEGTPNPLNPEPEEKPETETTEEMGRLAVDHSTTFDEVMLDANPSEPLSEVESEAGTSTSGSSVPIHDASQPEVIDVKRPATPKPTNQRPTNPIDMVKPTHAASSMPHPEATTSGVVTPMGQILSNAPVTAPAGSMGVVTGAGGTMPTADTLDPTNRPMEKAPTLEAPKPKKKTGLIVAMIICLFIAIGCGVAAALLFLNGEKEDVVAVAAHKLIAGENTSNVEMEGTINVDVKDATSPFSNLKISLDTEAVAKSMINSTVATLDASLKNGESISVEFDEIYAANGDLYLKVSGISGLLANPSLMSRVNNSTEVTEVTEVEVLEVEGSENSGEIDCYVEDGCPSSPNNPEVVTSEPTSSETLEALAAVTNILNVVDGEWIRISGDELSALVSDVNPAEGLSCAVNLISDFNQNNNSIVGMYKKNPFIGSTTKGLTVTSEQNPIYKVVFDEESFVGFANEVNNSNVMQSLASCLNSETASTNEMLEGLRSLPELYVEVDGNYDFTRLYFTTEIKDREGCCPEGAQCVRGCTEEDEVVVATVTTDLRFSYPVNVNIPEPDSYKDFSEIMQGLVVNTYEGQGEATTE